MAGRLVGFEKLRRFGEEIAAGAPVSWLRLLHPALQPPGTGRLRTLEGHSASVSGVAVMADGRRAVSASRDKTLKVSDLESGFVCATFYCDAAALCCAFAASQTIVAGDQGGRCISFQLEEGR
jgi:WD40 repeat protein